MNEEAYNKTMEPLIRKGNTPPIVLNMISPGINPKKVSLSRELCRSGVLVFDVMNHQDGHFICTMRMRVSRLSRITLQLMIDYILLKRPCLKCETVDVFLDCPPQHL